MRQRERGEEQQEAEVRVELVARSQVAGRVSQVARVRDYLEAPDTSFAEGFLVSTGA